MYLRRQFHAKGDILITREVQTTTSRDGKSQAVLAILLLIKRAVQQRVRSSCT